MKKKTLNRNKAIAVLMFFIVVLADRPDTVATILKDNNILFHVRKLYIVVIEGDGEIAL